MKSALRRAAAIRGGIQLAEFRRLRGRASIVQAYPKSGSTWLRSMLATAIVGDAPSYDRLSDLIPGLPLDRSRWRRKPTSLYVTHERRHVAPMGGVRIVQLVRNPLQVLPSYFEYRLNHEAFHQAPDLVDFIRRSTAGRLGDGYGSWQLNVSSWFCWPERLVVRYEDLQRDPAPEIRRITRFLGLDIPDERISLAVASNSREKSAEREGSAALLREYHGDFVGRQDRASTQKLNEAEVSVIATACGEVASVVGYEL